MRPEISTDNHWRRKKVFITGVCGTIGRELLAHVVARDPVEVVGLDNNESELFFLAEDYRSCPHVRLYLGDLRDRDEVIRKMRGFDLILHSAALKHVILCEHAPRDAVQTNVLGAQNVIDAAMAGGAERVLFFSSDKAVNPTNVMGTSKLMGERLVTAANAQRHKDGPIFASTRFGNVLGSRGSVIPLFTKQIAAGGPLTLTNPRMTRFIMTLQEAVQLVMESLWLARGGEVFVTKMSSISIADLAAVMIEELAPRHGYEPDQIQVEVIGNKPGEKLYEELLSDEETRRTLELSRYFVILPAFQVYDADYIYPGMTGQRVERPYNSAVEQPLSREELRAYLLRHGLL